ncbi:MAG: M56 family metallopeptidase [Dethiobacteria bacterium]|jgi:bla regulator protein BlaR1
MQSFLKALIQCSVTMSVLILLLIFITPLLEKKYAAKWRYYAWLVIVIGLIIPFRPHLDTAFIQVDVPVSPAEIQQIMPGNAATDAIGSNTTQQAFPTIPGYQLAGCLWIAGAATVITYYTLKHRRFIRMANRWGEKITNQQMIDTLQRLKDDLGISKEVKLQACPVSQTPMLIGFFRPVILLPPTEITCDRLALILRHELVHLKRNDLWYKALVLLATAIHWFNPVVYLMAKAIAVQCEISCDELVLQGTSFQQRKQYGETIMSVLKDGTMLQTALSTNFYGGKKDMKTRLFSIMDTTKKKAGITIFCVALIATIGVGIVFAANSANNSAKETAAETEMSFNSTEDPQGESAAIHYSMDNYSDFLTKVENDPAQYYYNDCWVRSLYDENDQILYFNAVEDKDVVGKGTPLYLQTVRNTVTNEVEKLIEMSEDEAWQLINNPDNNLIIMTITPPSLYFPAEEQETLEPMEID